MFGHPKYSWLKVFGVCILAGVAVSLFSACGVFEKDAIPESEQETAIEIPQRAPDIKDAVRKNELSDVLLYVRQIRVEVTLLLEPSDLDYLRNDLTRELPDFIFENRDPGTLLYSLELQERLVFCTLVDDDYIATSENLIGVVLAGPSSFRHRGLSPSPAFMDPERVVITLSLLPNPSLDGDVEPEVLFSGTWQEFNDLDDDMNNNFSSRLTLIKRPAERTITQPTERLPYFKAGIDNFSGKDAVYLKNQDGVLSAEYGSLHEYQFKTRSVWGEVPLESGMFIFRGNIDWNSFGSPVFVIGTNGQPIFLGIVVSLVLTDYHILEITGEGTGIALDMRQIFANLRGTSNPK